MKHFDILAQLEQVADNTQARRRQGISLAQSTAEARSRAALEKMRATIMPRIVRITNDQDDAVTLAVVNGRVADMTDTVMDGVHATPPETTVEHVAQILSMVCSGSGIRVRSTPPKDHDDIAATGLQMSEIDAALGALEPVRTALAPADDDVSTEANHEAYDAVTESVTIGPESTSHDGDDSNMGIAARFFENAQKISDQRILVGHDSSAVAGPDSVLAQNIDAVQQMMNDLSTWEADSDRQDTGPQLVILRAQSQNTPSLTICRDVDATSMTAHHTRKLGAVVQMWKSLTTQRSLN